MLLIKGSKLHTPKIFSCIAFVLCIPVLSSGCQTIDHQSSDKTTPDPTLLIEQDRLGDRIAELARREEALVAREIAVSSRESEVVTVLAELLKQKNNWNNSNWRIRPAQLKLRPNYQQFLRHQKRLHEIRSTRQTTLQVLFGKKIQKIKEKFWVASNIFILTLPELF